MLPPCLPCCETELKYILLPPSSDVQVVCPRNKKSELIDSIFMDGVKERRREMREMKGHGGRRQRKGIQRRLRQMG